jgi:hypothetical protein
MKKLLLLLLSAITYGQDMYLDHSFINGLPISVGDTLSIKFNTIDNNNSTYKLLQFDYQYNNKLLQKIDHTFYTDGPQTSLNHWDGYSFNPNTDISLSDLTGQYNWWAGGASTANTSSYFGSSDWSVERITLQHTSDIPHAETILIVRFLLKDKANTNYSDYNNISKLSWARADGNVVYGMTNVINLQDIKGGGAGDVVLKLNTQAEQKEDYMYSIMDEVGAEITSGNFDANGEAIIQGLENDIEYQVGVWVNSEAAWLGDVVSLTDAYMLFLQAINAGENPDQQDNIVDEIRKVVYDVNADGVINFDDSYALLMHVIGEPLENTYITADKWAYNISDLDKPFKPTENDKTFNAYHYLAGDADFSHSHYEAQVAVSRFSLAKENVIDHDLDLTTELVNGKIEFVVNLDRDDLSAIEFITDFDETKLEFEKIVFDSGDVITNYSTIKNNSVYFGSIEPEGKLQIKTGKSYKIVFNPKVEITNAAGLIYSRRQEAVTTAGQKLNLNLK